jgi:hypothetical protein
VGSTAYRFASEDQNSALPQAFNNGVCDAGEDKAPGPFDAVGNTLASDRHLTPGNVASVTSSVTTDATGAALVLVTYPKQFANWVEFNLEATLLVGGTEGSATLSDRLNYPISDEAVSNGAPAWVTSPFPYSADRPTCP